MVKLFYTILTFLYKTHYLFMPRNFQSKFLVSRYKEMSTWNRMLSRENLPLSTLMLVLFTVKVRLIVLREFDGNEELCVCRYWNANCRMRRDLMRLKIKADAGSVYSRDDRELANNLKGVKYSNLMRTWITREIEVL